MSTITKTETETETETQSESNSEPGIDADVHAATTKCHSESTILSKKQQQILEYLIEQADQQTYFKSRLIAAELGLSAKEVGANMPAIIDETTIITIEKWGYSSGTTWKVILEPDRR